MRLALGLVLALRALLLVRFGFDPMWANEVYMLQAKSLVVGPPQIWGPPGALALIVLGRACGLSALGALEASYLVAHLVFAAGVMGLARAIWPSLPRAREVVLAVLVAALPSLAGAPGYEDIGAMLGAAWLVATAAAAISCAARPEATARALALPFLLALAGAATRTEAVAGGLALALVVAIARRAELPSRRRVALAVAGGVVAGLAATALAHRAFVGRFELAAPTYPFYVFSVGLPARLCAAPCGSEYPAYAESMRLFGSFDDNHGSPALALLRHPGAALGRVGWKIVEWADNLVDRDSFGPIVLALAAVGLVLALRSREAPRRGWLLCAWLAPAALLLAPPVVTMYAIVCAPPILLAAALGAERLFARLPWRWPLWLACTAGVGYGVARAAWLHPGPSVSPVLHETAAWLEANCKSGCLTNYPPPHVGAEAWVNLEAGAPFPPRNHTAEPFVLKRYPDGWQEGVRFAGRVARARQSGYRGPIYYLDAETPTARSYSDLGFDHEHDSEGPIDLAQARLIETLTDGPDKLRIWALP